MSAIIGLLGSGDTLRSPELEPVSQTVAILDAGAQYGKVIDRRVRNLGIRSEVLPLATPVEDLQDFDAIIISGGPQSVYSADAPIYDPRLFEIEKPMLGICYGMQLMNHALGGTVEQGARREDGPAEVQLNPASSLFMTIQEQQQTVLMSHGDSVNQLAPGFRIGAFSGDIIAAIEDPNRKMYGVQFHPEMDTTQHGKDMLSNFLFEISELEPNFTVEDRGKEAIDYIREIVGDSMVISLLSGGVDSLVNTVLLRKALPREQIIALHVDHGLMRDNESKAVVEISRNTDIDLAVIDASKQFLNATTMADGVETPLLSQVVNPETKRRIIGDTFMKVAEAFMKERGLDPSQTFLAQGTLRPDLIESASKLASSNATVIKTHHNDTELVRQWRKANRIVEPLKDLHKDEVRELGKLLGLPDELVWRQPFPGPGLGVRIICAEKPYFTESSTEIAQSLSRFNTDNVSATLLPVQTVGVQGDSRTYSHLVGLSGKANWDELVALAREIPKQVHGVNRVVYLFGDRLNGPINEITPTHLTPDAINQLRQADKIVTRIMAKHGLLRILSQVPVVSFPVHFGIPGNRSIGIRTIITNDFMDGLPAIPGKEMPIEALQEMVEGILSVPGISRVAYDLMPKPPGTIEWE